MSILFTNIKENIKRTMVIMSLPVILYFMVGPLSVYCANLTEQHFYISDFFYTLLIIGLVILIAGSFLLSLLPSKLNKAACVLIAFFGIMSYVQDMWLNVKLAEDNGANMDWSSLTDVTRNNTIIWLVSFILIMGLTIWLKGRFVKAAFYISGFIAAVQLITLLTLIASGISVEKQGRNQKDYGLVGDVQYEVASDSNIIVFVVDTWGSSQLDNGIANNSHLLDAFADFTYYDNADSSYFRTFPSMTHMLTGVDISFDESCQDYLRQAWTSDEAKCFFDDVHSAGYNFYLYSTGGEDVYGDAANQYGLIDNTKEITWNVDKNAALIRMAKISIYKFVPYVLKPRFEVVNYLFGNIASYADAVDVNCGNSLYYDGLVSRGLSLSDNCNNAVIVQHIDGTHEPYTTSSECVSTGDGTLQSTQEGIVYEITEYMNRLKELGLYDSATIIITADHSSWTYKETADDPQIVYFVKLPQEHHDSYETNSAPISHDDFRATIIDLIGLDYSSYGKSIFDYSEGDTRSRTIVNQEYDDSYPRVAGSVSNIYSVYTYTGNREDFTNKVQTNGADEVHALLRD